MSSEIDESLAPFLLPSNAITRPILTTAVTFFVHGIYTILFGKCIHLLCWKYNQKNRNLYLAWTTALFVLITTEVLFGTVGLTKQAIIEYTAVKGGDYGDLLHYLHGDRSKTVQHVLSNGIPVIVNMLADSMLIYRCYIIWDSNKRLIYSFIVALLAINSIAVASVTLFAIGINNTANPTTAALFTKGDNLFGWYLITNVVLNFAVTIMTGGRIWLISRQSRRVLGPTSTGRRHSTVVAIIFESGILYPIALVMYIIVQQVFELDQQGLYIIKYNPFAMQFAGIAPTVVTVRALDTDYKTVRNRSTVPMTTMHFASRHEDTADFVGTEESSGLSSRNNSSAVSIKEDRQGMRTTSMLNGMNLNITI